MSMRKMTYYDTYPDDDYLYHLSEGKSQAQLEHCHSFFEFFITLSDNIVHIVNGTTQILVEGTLVFIRPSDVHHYVYLPNVKQKYVNLSFRSEVAEDLFKYLKVDGAIDINEILNAKIPPAKILRRCDKERLLSMVEEFNPINHTSSPSMRLKFRMFLLDVMATYFSTDDTSGNSTSVPKWMTNLMHQMEKHENFSVGLPKMVELSGRTREHVSRCVKKYLGMTTSEYIGELRLTYAANLLMNTDIRIIDICYESGFASIDYFGKQFKAKYGITPRQFRSNVRVKALE